MIPKEPDRSIFLSEAKSIARSIGASIKHPRWTSRGALEVDVFAPSPEDFQLFMAVVEPLAATEFARSLDEVPPFKPKDDVLKEAIGYFDSERFWECHETLEPLWRSAKGEERSLLQAIILVCAALVHEQRGERDVALGIYRRALPQLAWGEKTYHGIDVPRVRKNVEVSLAKGELPPFAI